MPFLKMKKVVKKEDYYAVYALFQMAYMLKLHKKKQVKAQV
jgi:hypothetical protein